MEKLCSFVSSRGILKSCDHHNKNPQSSSSDIDVDLLNGFQMGNSIYVCYEGLPNFIKNFLPNIHLNFTLVTGDSDHNLSMYKEEVDLILGHPNLINWFVQNKGMEHPKLKAMPIGLDFHTVWEKKGNWGLRAVSPLAQERLLINNLNDSPQQDKKLGAYYCNWLTNGMYGDRQECFDKIEKEFCFMENLPRARKYMLQRQAEFFFTVSPSGFGYDCHRTYEALVLGSVPIVKRNSFISDIFNGMPIIQVEDWSEVNGKNMDKFLGEILNQKFNFNPLFLQHWVAKINGEEYSPIPNLGLLEFRELLTANYF